MKRRRRMRSRQSLFPPRQSSRRPRPVGADPSILHLELQHLTSRTPHPRSLTLSLQPQYPLLYPKRLSKVNVNLRFNSPSRVCVQLCAEGHVVTGSSRNRTPGLSSGRPGSGSEPPGWVRGALQCLDLSTKD
ncbi:hypothetical protein EYF80_054201 [Liparis tanakae]|uniref:Uncharacterized protein n=1 Tax=Liparis tanakae TaxID=230148 RepID=A0A4Z2F4E1_9TELE|nr:hypothetical protein EYF80_054201 [Liparis tanakae]